MKSPAPAHATHTASKPAAPRPLRSPATAPPAPALSAGAPHPLGATCTPDGINFALFSEHAVGVDLCLFGTHAHPAPETRVRLEHRSDGVWHAFLPGLPHGQLYAYRVYGPYNPAAGHRFNASKLLLDPYARAIAGPLPWHDSFSGYTPASPRADLQRDFRDSGPHLPRCVAVNPAFDWQGVTSPSRPLEDSVIYEIHPKGFTKLCPDIPEPLRGTYAGLGSPPAIAYLKKLGVTAIELLPVHQHLDEGFLRSKGLSNYWGYATLGFFAPEAAYATPGATHGQQVAEFQTMVRNLHAAGLEVILDVVYNHTGEGNHLGATLSFRGIDNATYYRSPAGNPRYCQDFTGTGNSLNLHHPQVLKLVLDSLRHWVTEMGVDGFRFDLATTLARGEFHFSSRSAFFHAIHQDPVLSRVKLIAEPWDIGDGGYQLGAYPRPWSEWNGKYRDDLRSYWKGDGGLTGALASRFTGSPDIFLPSRRGPRASVNFLTSHDGFTLADLVSYNNKHNEANGEGNNDGDNNNHSWNWGAEGPASDPVIRATRARLRRSLLATLLLSQGVPMLLGGDEFGRTQNGNNNAYCQDNPLSWLTWERDTDSETFLDFTRRLIALRHSHPIFRRRTYFEGHIVPPSHAPDVSWFRHDGAPMPPHQWGDPNTRTLQAILNGHAAPACKPDDTFLLLFNAHHEIVKFRLPGKPGIHWELLLDTNRETGFLPESQEIPAGSHLPVMDHALCLLRLLSEDEQAAIAPFQG